MCVCVGGGGGWGGGWVAACMSTSAPTRTLLDGAVAFGCGNGVHYIVLR